jgi:cellobiose phosphorylase
VTCGNSDGPASPYFGRGGWSWYTGSAQWLHRVAVTDIIGVRATYEGLVVAPCVPKAWNEFTYVRKFRGATYQFDFKRGDTFEMMVDGKKVMGHLINDYQDNQVHLIQVCFT